MTWLYKCERCDTHHKMEAWHQATAEALNIHTNDVHGLDDEEVDDCFYHCPTCNQNSNGYCIEPIFINPKNNEDALLLLND